MSAARWDCDTQPSQQLSDGEGERREAALLLQKNNETSGVRAEPDPHAHWLQCVTQVRS